MVIKEARGAAQGGCSPGVVPARGCITCRGSTTSCGRQGHSLQEGINSYRCVYSPAESSLRVWGPAERARFASERPAVISLLCSLPQAEARLAAKRAARAEAREIRMKELERQQKEVRARCWGHDPRAWNRGASLCLAETSVRAELVLLSFICYHRIANKMARKNNSLNNPV